MMVKCGMSKRSNLIGKVFGRLTVVSSGEGPLWNCVCVCGRDKVTTAKQLNSGKTASCGCLFADVMTKRNTVHGLTKKYPREYRSWKDMRSRCNTDTDSDFKDYGGRGISVCIRWNEFSMFFEDMGIRPLNMTIDRIDVNGNYEPGNCRWATSKTQANNRRTNHLIEWNGETKTLAEWCSQVGIEPSKVRYRIKQNWALDKVFDLVDFRL